jgi:hypothetical protein
VIKEKQIRKFKNKKLPNIEVGFIRENGLWLCTFTEDFKYPYISLTDEQLELDTEIIKEKNELF